MLGLKTKLKQLKSKSIKNTNWGLIGVFDSGLGGLSIFRNIVNKMPNYQYIYLGDTARVPYGEKSKEIIYTYTKQAMHFLFNQGCNLVLLACNTASAQALRRLQQEFLPKHYPDKKILGVIRPLAEEFAQKNYKHIGIIGTKATIKSKVYLQEIQTLNSSIKIEQKSTPLLVPLIEEGWAKKPETKMILKKYLHPLKTKQIQALILACTHYPFLLSEIQRIMGTNVYVPDPGEIVANSLLAYINRHPEIKLNTKKQQSPYYYTTDDVESFKKLGEKFLNQRIKKVEHIKISHL